MLRETIFSMKSPSRDEMRVTGFRFGSGKKSCAVVGAMRGNEFQQLYIASRLVSLLREMESKKQIVEDCEILVIPCVNNFSMNIGSRFWAFDNTDINRMFPGYKEGETTQRIAARVFELISNYTYGIQFASFYMNGDFIPHISIMNTGFQGPDTAHAFGLPYILFRNVLPIDTGTLNYNWQLWKTTAFSLYSGLTDYINEEQADLSVQSVCRFLNNMGLINCNVGDGYVSSVIYENDIISVKTKTAGILRRLKKVGQHVKKYEILGEICDPYDNTILEEIHSPVSGHIFYIHRNPLIYENTVIYKIICSDL